MRLAPLVPKPKPSSNSGKRKPRGLPFARSHGASVHDSSESGANDLDGFTAVWSSYELPSGIKAKLEVGSVNDPLEQQADAIADRVMRMPSPNREPSGGPTSESTLDTAELDADVEDEALSESPTFTGFAGEGALPGVPGVVARKCASCEVEDDDDVQQSIAGAQSVMRECETCEDEDVVRRACSTCDVDGTEKLARNQAVPFEVVMEFSCVRATSERSAWPRVEVEAPARGPRAWRRAASSLRERCHRRPRAASPRSGCGCSRW